MYTSKPTTGAGWEEAITEILTSQSQSAHKIKHIRLKRGEKNGSSVIDRVG